MTTNTHIQKWGNSQGIRLPKYILNDIEWSENEEIILKTENGKIILEKKLTDVNIKDLFATFEGEYEQTNFDWGHSVGDELW